MNTYLSNKTHHSASVPATPEQIINERLPDQKHHLHHRQPMNQPFDGFHFRRVIVSCSVLETLASFFFFLPALQGLFMG
ncbi:hypothetical protein JHK82_038994 [Glycine max]|nr:hypothetical protein JHK87_038967 [Glycine soja]KAG4962304.1 hypothetical protein JHK86_039172 [Glycine max]KAG4964777.1 hypothetical protein JHK85_039752 [Glycine max]KAG5109771.1 hypothetical protein JHK82_038994 [Glycine max]KAG5121059.1 hypothetical protein JHK84_039399 [Glycine max]